MGMHYTDEFRDEAVRFVLESKMSVSQGHLAVFVDFQKLDIASQPEFIEIGLSRGKCNPHAAE